MFFFCSDVFVCIDVDVGGGDGSVRLLVGV